MKRLFFITFLMLVSTAAWSQAITGTILGTITDPSGAVLPGVSITAVNVGTNLTREVISNESGNYSIPNLTIGNYRVEAELTGFKKEVCKHRMGFRKFFAHFTKKEKLILIILIIIAFFCNSTIIHSLVPLQ